MLMRRVLTLVVALGYLCCATPAGALDPSRGLDEHTILVWRDELPQATVNAVLQTRDGYLWLGTYEGLVRFNGVEFRVFDRHTTPELHGNAVTSLFEDRDGRLWIGTIGGLSSLHQGRFERVLDPSTLQDDIVVGIGQASSGALWVAGNRTLLRIGQQSGWQPVSEIGLDPDESIRSMLVDGETVWLGFESGRLARHEGGQSTVFGHRHGLPEVPLQALARAPDGMLWIGTDGHGLLGWRDEGVTERHDERRLGHGSVRALFVGSEHRLWIGTDGGGVARLERGSITRLSSASGLPSDLIRCFAEDREGTVWVGTNGGGLAALQDRTFVAYTVKDGLSHGNVRVVMEDRDGTIWVGSDGGGLDRIRSGRVSPAAITPQLPSRFVRALWQDADGALWIGTTGGGLVRQSPDGAATRYSIADGLGSDTVYSVLGGVSGELWVGTDNGLSRRVGSSFATLGPADGLSHHNITALAEAADGGLWVGTIRGLNRVGSGPDHEVAQIEDFAGTSIFALSPGARGELWVGTDRGLARMGRGDVRFYNRAQGLYDDVVFSVLEDGEGSLWTSSNRGIARVAIAQLDAHDRGELVTISHVAYGTQDGLPATQCNGVSQPAGWRTRDGRLLFPTVQGLAVVDPHRLRLNPLPPPVVVERVVVDDAEVDSRLPVLVPPGSQRLQIDLAALTFVSPARTSYRHRLEPFDRFWVETIRQRSAVYTHLPPGRYTFLAQAANSDGVWNTTGATLQVEVLPHLWQTWWFLALVIFVVVGLLWTAQRRRAHRNRQRQRELEHLVLERTEQLEVANRILERLSNLDGLTGVANRRHLDAILAFEWRRASRTGSSLGLLLVDVDAFKTLNDTLGHQVGDDYLRRIATALQESSNRAGELVARYGGEEFAVVLPGVDREAAAAHADRLRRHVRGLSLPHPTSPVAEIVTVSVGVAVATPAVGLSVADLVRRADEALYHAKSGGRDRVEVAV